MNYQKARPGLLWLTIFLWGAYLVCGIAIGTSNWIVKLLSLTAIGFSGYLLFYVRKHIEAKKEVAKVDD